MITQITKVRNIQELYQQMLSDELKNYALISLRPCAGGFNALFRKDMVYNTQFKRGKY